MISFRPYQQALIDDIRSALTSGYHSVCAVLGCGGGKSIIQGSIAAQRYCEATKGDEKCEVLN